MFVLSWISLLTSSLVVVDAYPSLRAFLDPSSRQLDTRDGPSIQATDPYDHTWIETFASIGDSFAAGLGAGHSISAANNLEVNDACYQYSYGYGNLLNGNDMIGVNPRRVFQYLGCSGALTSTIRDKQVPKMRNSQLITISAGGNDAQFADILNYCVYQWSTWFFWSCEGEIEAAKTTIDSQTYNDDMTSMIQAVAKKLQDSTSRIYWVGYTRFFDTSTDECDSVTWGMAWKARKQYLTQDRRSKMNDLADRVNDKIKSACAATAQCVFIDPNPGIDTMSGHYCEPGVDETYPKAADREETWPYEWGTTKDDDSDDEGKIDQPQKRKRNDIPGPVDNSTFEGAIANYISSGVEHSTIDPDILASFNGDGFTAQGSLLPDKYGRVFHMTKWGNGVIAANILKAMDAEQAKIMNQPAVTTTLSVCTNLAIASATATAAAKGKPCEGNQIQGDCVQATMPSPTPNSGPLAPVCNKVDANNDELRINDKKAQDAASTYCDNLISDKTFLDSSNTSPNPGTQPDAAENGGTLSLTVLFDNAACDPGTADDAQNLNFTAIGREKCFDSLYTPISQYCSQDSSWGNYDADYTLEGGVVGIYCALWSLSGGPAS